MHRSTPFGAVDGLPRKQGVTPLGHTASAQVTQDTAVARAEFDAAAIAAVESEIAALEAALPGVSVREGLARMRFNVSLYRRLLASFCERRRDIATALDRLRQTGDLDQLYLESHNIKGEAGNLGFRAVRASADALGLRIRAGDTAHLPNLTRTLIDDCQAVLELLHELPPASEPLTSPNQRPAAEESVDRAQLRALTDRLKAELQAKNLGAGQQAAELEAFTRGSALFEQTNAIATAVRQLHYDVALALLEEIRGG